MDVPRKSIGTPIQTPITHPPITYEEVTTMPTVEWHGWMAYVTAATLPELQEAVNNVLRVDGNYARVEGPPFKIGAGEWGQTLVHLCIVDGGQCPHYPHDHTPA